ncbi:hypothetical protein DPMN_177616 [Dreissena polymorpha]|uniref:HAT C-terminal dimerisation domain-containing protein n=1 Tax=Dreissena polymorpha TaxID=45954 RepID=A0A9D4IKP9_DREPO|nr:hypothetical protein DPMN_177616 [Dreissena polymorpha]
MHNTIRVHCQPDDDLLTWWSEHNISQQFCMWPMKLLPKPSTFVASERVFSKTGRLVTKARNRISHKLVDKVIVLAK